MASAKKFSNNLRAVTELEQEDDNYTDSLGVENIFRCCELLTTFLRNKKWSEIGDTLTTISKALLKPENRKSVPLQALESLGIVLHVSAAEFKVDSPSVAAAVSETFRALRNSCVGEPKIQKDVTEKTVAVDETCNILKALSLLPRNEHNVFCLRVGTQFLGNIVVNNKDTQPIVWRKCSEVLIDLLKYEDKKVANYSSMVIYNILLGHPDISAAVENCKEILEILIDHAMADSEFALFTVELLLSRMGYLPKVYEKVAVTHRLFLLDAVHFMITADGDARIPVTSITFLASQFKVHSDCILKTCEKYVEGLEPAEVSKLLQLLASASANGNYRSELQKDTSLLITCSMLLCSMHNLGKMGQNNFSAVQKLADLSSFTQSSNIHEHPAFGFKSCLVQMLGNLCWRHPENQNQALVSQLTPKRADTSSRHGLL
ncbi:ataxin-10 isoform X2 [Zootermopsis nevadensis]|uniref:ataxin-10 isoform X2 n=1 Tax=Zootermopsis nevadensis TaxID=136037 RepID=UPI000B8EC22F|nr:ataxin-10 isoform X2 [Zootermopsis nevadensis]XP_021941731.1 ataxin-10 isoform X2 [Zootermopsis nevadensis]